MEYVFYHVAKALPLALVSAGVSSIGWRLGKQHGWIASTLLLAFALSVGTLEGLRINAVNLGFPNNETGDYDSFLYSFVFILPAVAIYFWSLNAKEFSDFWSQAALFESNNKIATYAFLASAQSAILVALTFLFSALRGISWIKGVSGLPILYREIIEAGQSGLFAVVDYWLLGWSAAFLVLGSYLKELEQNVDV